MKKSFKFKFILIFLFYISNEKLKSVNIPQWLKKRISFDLTNYKSKSITKEMLDNSFKQEFPNLVRITITNGKVNLKEGKKGALNLDYRLNPLIKFLTDVTEQFRIPNVEFVVDIGDGFHGNSFVDGTLAPIFSFSKNKKLDKNICLIPAAGIFQDHIFIPQFKEFNTKFPFSKKINKVIWRGSVSGEGMDYVNIDNFLNYSRFKLTELSRIHPNLIDAKITNLGHIERNFNLKNKLIELSYVGNRLSVEDQFQYRYQVLVDGNTTTWSRAYWQIFSNCLIFKPQSDNIEWYYEAIKANKHYIAIKNDLSDLPEKIKWAKENANIVQKIINKANNFANKNLNYTSMLFYMAYLLNEYAKKQNF